MKRMVISALVFCAAASAVSAAEITITLPEGLEADRSKAVYACGDREIPVEYINAGPVSLAVLTLGEETIVASNVISASGARYAGGQYIWWTKGDEASLYDLTQGEDAPPVACTAAQ